MNHTTGTSSDTVAFTNESVSQLLSASQSVSQSVHRQQYSRGRAQMKYKFDPINPVIAQYCPQDNERGVKLTQ